jgi:hypothetical protein
MTRNQRYGLICTLSLMCICLVACFWVTRAQESDTRLLVTITDDNGAPIEGASVVIDQEDCECVRCPAEVKNCKCCETRNGPPTCCIVGFRRSSDEKGNAIFEVGPGIYRAKVQVPNFKSQEVKGIQVSGGRTKTVEIKMGVNGVAELLKAVEGAKVQSESMAKVLTIKLGDQAANASVTVMKAGCSCDKCPNDKVCPSRCCECKQGDCVCCIVAAGNTNEKGTKSFLLAPGEYDIKFTVADELSGNLSGVTIGRKDKVVKVSVTPDARPER